MHDLYVRPMSRRGLLRVTAGFAAVAIAPKPVFAALERDAISLTAAPAQARLVPGQPETAVLAYNGSVPGPEIRVRQGDRLRVVVSNGLDQETTVHWHGIRTRNAMDGVPHLTQKPIGPGETFHYEFDVQDAGTFWYHPHHHSMEQVGRGLAGPLIVEEHEPIQVDRDVTWLLGDWRLKPDASISDDFGNFMDLSHGGRVGNTPTINGRLPDDFAVRSGERVRLRLINGANARIFGLTFEGHDPQVVAVDGHPVEPHRPNGGRVVIAPAQRVDLVIDMGNDPGGSFRVVDDFYPSLAYELVRLAYSGDAPVRSHPLDASLRLPDNPVAEPDPSSAARHEVILGGGMMGMMQGAMMYGEMTDMRTMMRQGMAWAINGVAAVGHALDPVFTVKRGQTCVVSIVNQTRWHHPMHLHGHTFRVLSRNGAPTRHREWQDTVLLDPDERVEIAFVADNPGDWMFHCHILEHQASGMMSVIRVA